MYQEYPISAWENGEVVILYQYKKAVPEEVPTSPKSAKISRRIGLGLVSFSILTIFFILINQILPEVKYTFAKALESKREIRQSSLIQKENLAVNSEKENLPKPASDDFSLIIPKIGMNVKVLANVDPESPKEYKVALKEGVAHAKNSALPGQIGVTYMFAHSSGYVWNPNPLDSIFYPLSKLSEGDIIYVVFKSKLYKYKVSSQSITDAKDMSSLTIQPGERKLVLQTCWPPGTNWKRLFVIAYPAAFEMDASQTIQLVMP